MRILLFYMAGNGIKGAIAGATVSARSNFSGKVAVVKSDADGWYKLAGLQQGRYSAFAKAEGYGCVWVPEVFLFRGERTRVDFTFAKAHVRRPAASS
jgi:hypothetical protein